MEYYTRNFHTRILPYHILDRFTIYDEAESYNEEFFNHLLNIKKAELLALNPDSKNMDILSPRYTVEAAKLLTNLPTDIRIPDTRVFLLYGVSPKVYEQIKHERERQDTLIQNKLNTIQDRYKHDSKIVAKHWLDIYNIQWQESVLNDIEYRDQDIILRISDAYNDEYTVELINGAVLYSEKEIIPSQIIFTETLLKDSKLVLNVLGYDNEFTIEASDITIVSNGLNG